MLKNLIALPIGDLILSMFALNIAFLVRFGSLSATEKISELSVRLLIFGLVILITSFFLEMYNHEKNNGRKEIVIRVFSVILISFIILSSLYYMIPSIWLGRGLLLLSIVTFGLFQFLWHVLYRSIKNFGLARRVLILGTGPLAQKIGKIVNSQNNGYVLVGFMQISGEPISVSKDSILYADNGLIDVIKEKKAQKIIVSLSERRGSLPLKDILRCKLSGIEVVESPSFYEELTGKLLIEETAPSWFIFSDGFKVTSFKLFFKRTLDILISAAGLILFIPFIPVISFLIKIDSRGPIFFKQRRIGVKEKIFTIYKFRTMYKDAEQETGAVWTKEDDPRITRMGKLLRKFRIDEVPQLFNVLKGDMSIVGPRPERPEFVDDLKVLIPYYSERHMVKPGITGWAQIRYRYGSSVNDAMEKLRYDLYYIKHFSIFFDLMIIMETIKTMLFTKGAR